MKKIVFMLFLLLTLSSSFMTASAEEARDDTDAKELYQKQYESSGAGEVFSLLPEETLDFLKELEITPENPDSFSDLKTENIFSLIWRFVTTGAIDPIRVTTFMLGLVLIFAAIAGMGEQSINSVFGVVVCLSGGVLLLEPVLGLINGVINGITTVSSFMLSFIPVYAAILTTSGFVASAGGFSTLLLGAAEVFAQLISGFLLPAVSGCLCLGITGALAPELGANSIAEFFKKIYLWVMGIITTVFLSVLSMQTAVTVSADSLGLKTSKAVLSGSIPVMGPAISETLGVAEGCLSLLRSGVGIYGALAVIILLLPVVIELCLFRMGILICSGVASIFGMKEMVLLLKSVDFCLSVLIGSAVFVSLLFIISLTVIAPK